MGGGWPGIAKLFAKFTAGVKAGSKTYTEVRSTLERGFADFATRVNNVLRAAERESGKRLVVIVDGLEKLQYQQVTPDLSSHHMLFVKQAALLKAPCCHVIYTVPMSLVYEQNLEFSPKHVLPMVDVSIPKAVDLMRELLAKRVDLSACFENPDEAVPKVAKA